MQNNDYMRNRVMLAALIILVLLTAVFVGNYMDRNTTYINIEDIETEDVKEEAPDIVAEAEEEGNQEENQEISEITEITEITDGLVENLEDLIDEGYSVSVNGIIMTRITRDRGEYTIYGIDDIGKVVYTTYSKN